MDKKIIDQIIKEMIEEGIISKLAAKGIAKAKFLKGPSKKTLGKMSGVDKAWEKTISSPIRNAYRKKVAKKAAVGVGAVGVTGAVAKGVSNSSKNTQANAATASNIKAATTAASAIGVAALAVGLKKLYNKFKSEKNPEKKTVLKSKINKVKSKIKAKKAVKESYNFTVEEAVEIFGEGIVNIKAEKNKSFDFDKTKPIYKK